MVIPKASGGAGVGATLMEAVESAALAEGKERLRIDVVRSNPVLKEIWEGFGFQVVKDASIEGIQCAFMEKVLKPTGDKPHNSRMERTPDASLAGAADAQVRSTDR